MYIKNFCKLEFQTCVIFVTFLTFFFGAKIAFCIVIAMVSRLKNNFGQILDNFANLTFLTF